MGGLMDRRVQEDGTVIVSGQVVPTGGAQPTIASVVSYSGNAGLQSTNVEGALDELDNEKAPITHTHDDRYFTEVEVTNLLAGKAASNHTHDDRYFTEIEVTDLINTHLHDDRYYTEAEVDALISEALGSISEHANPSFETLAASTQGNQNTGAVASRDMPEGWDCGWNFPITSLSYPRMSVETGNTYSPGHAYRVDFDGNYNTHQYVWSPGFACPAGSVVTVELMVYTSASHIKVDLGILTGDAPTPNVFTPGYDIQSNGFYSSAGAWTKQKASFVVKAGHSYGRLQFRVNNDGVGAGYALIDDTRSSVQIVPPSSVVTGEMKEYPAGSPPSGYLEANGGSFSATTYPALAALYGDKYGTHSGDTYYLPKKLRTYPDVDWTPLPLLNGWGQYGAATALFENSAYCRVNGVVYLRGLIQGNARTSATIAQLGAGFRPKPSIFGGGGVGLTVDMSDTNATRVDVFPDGTLQWVSGGVAFLSLNQLFWPVDPAGGTIMTIIKAD